MKRKKIRIAPRGWEPPPINPGESISAYFKRIKIDPDGDEIIVMHPDDEAAMVVNPPDEDELGGFVITTDDNPNKPNWYDWEVDQIAKQEKVSAEKAQEILESRLSAITEKTKCSRQKALDSYNLDISARIQRDSAVQTIMEQKGVSREVAESEYDHLC